MSGYVRDVSAHSTSAHRTLIRVGFALLRLFDMHSRSRVAGKLTARERQTSTDSGRAHELS